MALQWNFIPEHTASSTAQVPPTTIATAPMKASGTDNHEFMPGSPSRERDSRLLKKIVRPTIAPRMSRPRIGRNATKAAWTGPAGVSNHGMTALVRPYLFYGATQALCATCLQVVQAKEVIEDGRVYLLQRCRTHGPQRVLIADDAAYWRWARERFVKAPEQVAAYNTPHRWGCPYDCGICPEIGRAS